MLAIERLLSRNPDRDAVDGFVKMHAPFPLIEGGRATFVYRGDANSVELRHWVYGLDTTRAFSRVENTDLWYYTLEVPPASRIEYKISVDGRWIRDPLNPHLAHDPFGANSVAQGEGYEYPEWAQEDPNARKGQLLEMGFRSPVYGGDRHLVLYKPARFRPRRRYPLLVVHDGGDYLKFAAFKNVLDNLIHRLELRPLIVAFTHPYDRLTEYADDERNAVFLCEELVPYLEDRLPVLGNPGSRGVMGASFGGVASLSAAWRYPGFFGRLLLQSGSFAFTDIGNHKRGPAFDPVVEFMNQFRANPGRPSDQVFMSVGQYESLIYENRSMLPLLQNTGMRVKYVEARDGHNWENWRDRLREGLTWLFPGPQLYVYE